MAGSALRHLHDHLTKFHISYTAKYSSRLLGMESKSTIKPSLAQLGSASTRSSFPVTFLVGGSSA